MLCSFSLKKRTKKKHVSIFQLTHFCFHFLLYFIFLQQNGSWLQICHQVKKSGCGDARKLKFRRKGKNFARSFIFLSPSTLVYQPLHKSLQTITWNPTSRSKPKPVLNLSDTYGLICSLSSLLFIGFRVFRRAPRVCSAINDYNIILSLFF